jgi:putative salt-induced outer membrane protein YdiY
MLPLLLAAALTVRLAASLAEPLVAPGADSNAAPTAPAETPAAAQEPEEPPMNEWNGMLTLFATYTDGNSDSEGYGGNAKAEYRREQDRTTLQFFYDKRFSEDQRTVDKRFAEAQYDYFLTEKAYWWSRLRFDVDREADLKLQSTAATGFGYQFLDGVPWKVNGEAGLSYVDQNYDGSAADSDFIAAALGYNVEYAPSERWSISQSTDYYPSLEDSDEWFLVADTKARLAFTQSISGSLTYLFTHQESPPAGNVQDDHNVMLGIDWNF